LGRAIALGGRGPRGGCWDWMLVSGVTFDWDVLGWDWEWIEGMKWEFDAQEVCILTSNQSSLGARRRGWLLRRSLAL
jgi:hypothetical protein